MSLDPTQVQDILADVDRHYQEAGIEKPAVASRAPMNGPPGSSWGSGAGCE